jgi:two-component system cell cycle response regulator DivK
VSPMILVVEDNPDNMKLFAWMLEDEGYDFVPVGSGEEALEALTDGDFDLVLMDISLPGMGGKEATRRIRENPRLVGLPVIAVTAHAIKGEDDAILASGVSALVTKPIDEALLLETMRDLLRSGVTHG